MLGEREQDHHSLHLVGQEYSSKTVEKHPRASQVASSKESACQYRRRRLDPWDRKVSWRKKWQPTQYSCMENSMERGAWWATVRRVTKSQTRLSHWTHTHTHTQVMSYGGKSCAENSVVMGWQVLGKGSVPFKRRLGAVSKKMTFEQRAEGGCDWSMQMSARECSRQREQVKKTSLQCAWYFW